MSSNRIKELRKARRLSQAQLATETGLSVHSINSYESGRRDPNSKAMACLERYFGVSGSYLLGETDDPGPMVWQDVELLQAKETGITTLLKNIQQLCADPATPEEVRSDAFDILQLLYSALRKREPAQQREAIRRLHDFVALSERYTAAPAQPPSK